MVALINEPGWVLKISKLVGSDFKDFLLFVVNIRKIKYGLGHLTALFGNDNALQIGEMLKRNNAIYDKCVAASNTIQSLYCNGPVNIITSHRHILQIISHKLFSTLGPAWLKIEFFVAF